MTFSSENTLEYAEVRPCGELVHILHFQVETEIRLVASVHIHRVGPFDSSEMFGQIVMNDFLEYMVEQLFHKKQDVVPFDETHFHVHWVNSSWRSPRASSSR